MSTKNSWNKILKSRFIETVPWMCFLFSTVSGVSIGGLFISCRLCCSGVYLKKCSFSCGGVHCNDVFIVALGPEWVERDINTISAVWPATHSDTRTHDQTCCFPGPLHDPRRKRLLREPVRLAGRHGRQSRRHPVLQTTRRQRLCQEHGHEHCPRQVQKHTRTLSGLGGGGAFSCHTNGTVL